MAQARIAPLREARDEGVTVTPYDRMSSSDLAHELRQVELALERGVGHAWRPELEVRVAELGAELRRRQASDPCRDDAPSTGPERPAMPTRAELADRLRVIVDAARSSGEARALLVYGATGRRSRSEIEARLKRVDRSLDDLVSSLVDLVVAAAR